MGQFSNPVATHPRTNEVEVPLLGPNGSYKRRSEGGQNLPPPPPQRRIGFFHSTECYAFWSWPRLSTLPDVSQFPDYFAFSRFENEATAQCFAFSK